MGCCEATNPNLSGKLTKPQVGRAWDWTAEEAPLDRRTAVNGMVAAAGALTLGSCSPASQSGLATLRLAFCGQLLCVIPYEVTRARGHFADEGFDVELVYTRGGNAAMQALVGGAVEYAGTSFDVALQASVNGAEILRFASTGRLPLFALAVSPEQSGEIQEIQDLEGRTIGISGLGNADHALALYVLDRAGADETQVRFAAIGSNIYDALRIGQVDAAMVQEPALSLILDVQGTELVNFMEIEQARAQLGGPYEFMGVAVRASECNQRQDEMRRLAAALARGLSDTRTIPPEEIIEALPSALVAGGDIEQLMDIIARYRLSLYPESVGIDVEAARRVEAAQELAGLLTPGSVDLDALLYTDLLEG